MAYSQEDYDKANEIRRIYSLIYTDILSNKKLEKHLHDIELAIQEIDKSIAATKLLGVKSTTLEEVKNDFYYLKYEILERT